MFNFSAPIPRVICVVAFVAALSVSVISQNQKTQSELSRSFRDFSTTSVSEVSNLGNGTAELRFRAGDRDVRVVIEPNDMRARRYKAEDSGPYGTTSPAVTDVNTFKGHVIGESDSDVRMTIDGSRVEGFLKSGTDTYFVEPASRYAKEAEPNLLVVYRQNDFIGEGGFACASEFEQRIENEKNRVNLENLVGLQGHGVIELATEADFEYVTTLGSASAANAEILSILNMVESTFESELDLSILVTYQHTWSAQDSYNGSNADTLLSSFRNHWNSDSELALVHRDAAHLFSGKNAVLSMGYASVGVICSNPSFAYGLSGYINWAPAKYLVTAHELGHNLNAGHAEAAQGCGSSIMNATLSGSTAMSFCTFSKDQIDSFNGQVGGCLEPPLAPKVDDFDFDGDSRTDTSIFRPSVGEWWYTRSTDGSSRAFKFGTVTDKPVPADYTGDGATDVAFWRDSTGEWFIMRSEDSSFYSLPFGAPGDIPAPADYDGDGLDDYAVFRPSSATWYISNSSGGTTIRQHGAAGDIPVVADYDGDGEADIAIFRPGVQEWWIVRSTGGVTAFQFGAVGDIPVPGEYTGDGSVDVAFFRPATGEWFVLRSEDSSFYSAPFGANGDVPVRGDYDGDGVADFAVWRPANQTWYLSRSTDGFQAVAFGSEGDMPVPSAYLP
ncbi:MAG: hypothetical protein HKN33_04105 [Pyrinomonadaceae bacterium]|nr:hypothetical protein [Pyrinomonadaceae bacterium]